MLRSRSRKFWKGRSWSRSRMFYLRLRNPARNTKVSAKMHLQDQCPTPAYRNGSACMRHHLWAVYIIFVGQNTCSLLLTLLCLMYFLPKLQTLSKLNSVAFLWWPCKFRIIRNANAIHKKTSALRHVTLFLFEADKQTETLYRMESIQVLCCCFTLGSSPKPDQLQWGFLLEHLHTQLLWYDWHAFRAKNFLHKNSLSNSLGNQHKRLYKARTKLLTYWRIIGYLGCITKVVEDKIPFSKQG